MRVGGEKNDRITEREREREEEREREHEGRAARHTKRTDDTTTQHRKLR
jgi:hypothetical protein